MVDGTPFQLFCMLIWPKTPEAVKTDISD